MAFVAAPNIVQAEIRAIKNGANIENRIYINTLHTPTAADLIAIENILATEINGFWPAMLPSDVTITELFLKSLQTQNDISRTLAFGGPLVGTAAGEPLPNQNSYAVKLTTGFTGRSARGRLYWLGLSISQVVSNQVEAAVSALILASMGRIRANLLTAGFVWSIVSFVSNGVPRPGGPVYFQITGASFTDSQVDTQRGRVS